MTNVALWVQLEAKKGKEAEVESFLRLASKRKREPLIVERYFPT